MSVTSLWHIIWASAKKDLRSALTHPLFLIQCSTLGLNYLITMSLFVLSGSNAPTAVVMLDRGPYAQQFYQAMRGAHSFRLEQDSAAEARTLIQAGRIVAVVTIPPDFETRLAHHQPIHLNLSLNNVQTDMTDDVRRGIRLATMHFYAQVFPGDILMTLQETDAYQTETDYVPYLALSTVVVCALISGLLIAGTGVAKEWEHHTMKGLYLSPAPLVCWVLGKLLAASLLGLLPLSIVLVAIVLVVGDWPLHWGLVLGASGLALVVFICLGLWLGMVLRQRSTLATLARGLTVPLTVLSGVFVPLSFLPPVQQVLARLFPVHYATVLEVYAFKSFATNTLSMATNALVLLGFGMLFFLLACMHAYRGRTSFSS